MKFLSSVIFVIKRKQGEILTWIKVLCNNLQEKMMCGLNITKATAVQILRGCCNSYQKLACFVLYLKIVNTFLKNASYSELFKELKNGIEILVGQAVQKQQKCCLDR